MMKARGFQKGTGSTYVCKSCRHNTRTVSNPDARDLGLCEPCYDIAGWENSYQDGEITLEELHAEAARLSARYGRTIPTDF